LGQRKHCSNCIKLAQRFGTKIVPHRINWCSCWTLKQSPLDQIWKNRAILLVKIWRIQANSQSGPKNKVGLIIKYLPNHTVKYFEFFWDCYSKDKIIFFIIASSPIFNFCLNIVKILAHFEYRSHRHFERVLINCALGQLRIGPGPARPFIRSWRTSSSVGITFSVAMASFVPAPCDLWHQFPVERESVAS